MVSLQCGCVDVRQIAGLCKPFVTDFAHKWFLSSVGALMSRQTAGLCKPFVTDLAPKWFLSSVGALMFVKELLGLCKPFVTDFAHKWFLSSVGALMYSSNAGEFVCHTVCSQYVVHTNGFSPVWVR